MLDIGEYYGGYIGVYCGLTQQFYQCLHSLIIHVIVRVLFVCEPVNSLSAGKCCLMFNFFQKILS